MKVEKKGFDYKIFDGNVEIAEIRACGSAFELRVHGVVWAEDGTANLLGGKSTKTFSKLFEAFLAGGMVFQQFRSKL